MKSEHLLADTLVQLIQEYIQRYGPIPDAAGAALKTAIAELLKTKPERKAAKDGRDGS